MNKGLVSIIIPVYNRESIVTETLDSVLAQSYAYWECILVDDGSTDNTLQVIQSYSDLDSRFKVFERPTHLRKGGNAARNFGLEQSVGDFINWFDSDDIMYERFIEDKLAVFLQDDNIDFVISKCEKFYPNKTVEEVSYYKTNHKFLLTLDNYIQEKVHWLTPDMMVKKACVKTIRFDENLLSGQEYNFFIKLLASQDLKGVYLNKVLCSIRRHSNSKQETLRLDSGLGFQRKYKVALQSYYDVLESLNEDSKMFMIKRLFKLSHGIILNKQIPKFYFEFLHLYFKVGGLRRTIILIFYNVLLFFGKDSTRLKQLVKIK